MSRHPFLARRIKAYAPGKEGRKDAVVIPFEVDVSKLEEPSVNGSADRETHPPHVR
jgi:hypothetical protein